MIWSDKDRFLGLETPSMASLAAPWPAQAMPAPAAVPGGRGGHGAGGRHFGPFTRHSVVVVPHFGSQISLGNLSLNLPVVVPHKAVAEVSEIGNL